MTLVVVIVWNVVLLKMVQFLRNGCTRRHISCEFACLISILRSAVDVRWGDSFFNVE